MKKLLILLVLFGSNDPAEIMKINRLKAAAEKAFASGNFEAAAEKYSTLYDSLHVTEPEIALNLAHSFYALGDSSNAKSKYQEVTTSGNSRLSSIAHQQLGVMAKSPQTLKQSLAHLKSAVKADPTNEGARYDYEVVKKLLDEQEKQQQQNKDNKDNKDQQDQQNQDQEKKDQQNKEQQNKESQEEQEKQEQQEKEKQEGEKGEQEKKDQQEQQEGEQKDDQQEQENKDLSTQKKLEEMNISEEKARMILEAMRSKEVQYIQQQKRKATKRPESGKPDW